MKKSVQTADLWPRTWLEGEIQSETTAANFHVDTVMALNSCHCIMTTAFCV